MAHPPATCGGSGLLESPGLLSIRWSRVGDGHGGGDMCMCIYSNTQTHTHTNTHTHTHTLKHTHTHTQTPHFPPSLSLPPLPSLHPCSLLLENPQLSIIIIPPPNHHPLFLPLPSSIASRPCKPSSSSSRIHLRQPQHHGRHVRYGRPTVPQKFELRSLTSLLWIGHGVLYNMHII